MRGRFIVRDPLKPAVTGAGAWVGLAAPRPGGNWQFESLGYQYWVKADEQGRFAISHVRPGTYTLFGFVDGAVGEFAGQGSRSKPVNRRAWATSSGKCRTKGANRLGNRRPECPAKEFQHGDEYCQGYLWDHFAEEFSNPLEYAVGKSDWRHDWNYAQARYRGGIAPEAHHGAFIST